MRLSPCKVFFMSIRMLRIVPLCMLIRVDCMSANKCVFGKDRASGCMRVFLYTCNPDDDDHHHRSRQISLENLISFLLSSSLWLYVDR